MFKKLLLSAICFSFIICGLPTHIKAEEVPVTEEYIEEWNEIIGLTAFFIYTPQTEEELLNLGDDEVIAVFEGVKVTKKLLNENLELDIDKITVNDFATNGLLPSFEINGPVDMNPTISPNAMLPNIVGTGGYDGYCNLPSWANGVIVSSTYQFSDGSNMAEVVFYLNNSDLKVYRDDLINLKDMVIGYALDQIVSKLLGYLPTVLNSIFTYLSLYEDFCELYFMSQVSNMCDAGKKGKITRSGSYKIIVEWTDNKFYARNGSLNGSIFKSAVNFLS